MTIQRTYRKQEITWQNITIELRYCPDYWKSGNIAHLEVSAEQALPITKTGYRSHWIGSNYTDKEIADFVLEQLQKESKTHDWISFLKSEEQRIFNQQQFSLF